MKLFQDGISFLTAFYINLMSHFHRNNKCFVRMEMAYQIQIYFTNNTFEPVKSAIIFIT